MALTDLQLPPITRKRAAHYTEGRTKPVRAFVNHRMVGTLMGTDAYFTNPESRPVSTHFGIGLRSDGKVGISQYVPLDDTAYGNGNYDPSGRWDEWGFRTADINAQTISIEHQDHGDPAGKGVVSDAIQLASIKLQALLRFGTLAEWRSAGIWIRDWDNNANILIRELRGIPVDGEHVITHNDISGVLKPYCWRPWQADTIGFPRKKYVTGIAHWGGILQNGFPVPAAPTYTQEQLDAAVKAATDPLNVQIVDLTKQLGIVKQETKQRAIAAITAL